MNMSALKLSVLALFSAFAGWSLSGCAGVAFAQHKTPLGFIYTDASTNELVTENAVSTKTGQTCATSILGIVTTGDASVATAAKMGGITKLASVDNDFSNVLGVYSKYCVKVSGE